MFKEFLIILAIFLVFGGLILLALKWQRIRHILDFRKHLKPGDTCWFKLGPLWVSGYVLSAWKQQNRVTVRYNNCIHKLKYYDIYP